jgi:hypothetical protein
MGGNRCDDFGTPCGYREFFRVFGLGEILEAQGAFLDEGTHGQVGIRRLSIKARRAL